MGWLRRLFGRERVPNTARYLGVGLWQSPLGWEVVGVHHDPEPDKFYFKTSNEAGGHVYGANVRGYDRNELATLYMTEKLTLCPARLFSISPDLAIQVAVIENVHGDPVLAEWEWQEGLEPLLADPAFHAGGL